MNLRGVLQLLLLLYTATVILYEVRLEQVRPRAPAGNFTIRVPTKHLGVGPIEYVYISRTDDLTRLALWALGAGCVVGGFLWDRRRR